MYITPRDVFLFVGTCLFLTGNWQLFKLRVDLKAWKRFREDEESFFDYCCRIYEKDFIWRLRRRFNIKWYYNSRAFKIFTILKGVLLVLLSIGIFVAVFIAGRTEYAPWLDIKL